MKIYEFDIDMDDYTYFNGDIDEDIFDGTPLKKQWNPIQATEGDLSLKKGDFRNWISTVFSCNEKTKEILEKNLIGKAEFLKVKFHEDFWIMNCTNVIDAIDYGKAIPVRTDSGILYKFDEYAFKKELVENQYIFKIPEFKTVRLFATEKFKNLIEENNITGPYFTEVWDSNK